MSKCGVDFGVRTWLSPIADEQKGKQRSNGFTIVQ